MRRRVNRRKHKHRNNSFKSSIISVVLIMFVSVTAGYVTATYVLGPVLGLDTEAISFDFINKEKVNNEDDKNKEVNNDDVKVVQDTIDSKSESGYALQYGSFSSRAGAKECVDELSNYGIEANIIEKDGSFKVIGELFDTKEEARVYKDSVTGTEDVFITEIP